MTVRGRFAYHTFGPLADAAVWPPSPPPPDFPRRSNLSKRIWFTLAALAAFRIGTYVPLPGVEPEALAIFMEQQRGGLIEALDLFAGGAFSRMTIFGLGVMPLILSAALMSIVAAVSPTLEALAKRDSAGRRKANQFTRIGAVILSALFGYAVAAGLESAQGAQGPAVQEPGLLFRAMTALTLAAGTIFLMWLAEQISARGIGEGVLLIILAGIVANFPSALAGTVEMGRDGTVPVWLVTGVVVGAIVMGAFILYIELAQRRVFVQYPDRTFAGKTYGGDTLFIPVKINSAGVLPLLYASALLFLPFGILDLITAPSEHLIAAVSSRIPSILVALLDALIVFFTFLCAFTVFSPDETASGLESDGGYIPGVQPGPKTAAHLRGILTHLTCIAAIYLVAIAALTEILVSPYPVPFWFSGTILLILFRGALGLVVEVQHELLFSPRKS